MVRSGRSHALRNLVEGERGGAVQCRCVSHSPKARQTERWTGDGWVIDCVLCGSEP